MHQFSFLILLITCLIVKSCSDELVVIQKPEEDLLGVESLSYFPPTNSNDWTTLQPDEIGWNVVKLSELYDFHEENGTRAFIILKDGKIVVEQYWGNNFQGSSFNRDSYWYWASAGKTVISFLIGIAQEEGLLNIEDKSSDYLGKGWTSLPPEQESLISIRHQLTMTTGLNYEVEDLNCTTPNCLTYKTDAGDQWYYHNAPYLLLKDVITQASGIDYNAYTEQKLENRIGMTGEWLQGQNLEVYWSSARDMARFGLLILNQGVWDNQSILSDQTYFQDMSSTSQDLNPSYGYLFWLNGKSAIIYPGFERSFTQPLAPEAPSDLYAAIGKNGQFINIIPSENMVVIRMGEAPSESLVPISFHNEMWKIMNQLIQ